MAVALLAACWHAREQAFIGAPQGSTSSSRLANGHTMSMKANYTVERHSSVQYIALCATALGAAALMRGRSVRPRIEKPRVVVQAFRMDQALPEMISDRAAVASSLPQAPTITRSDLIDCLDTPQTYSMPVQEISVATEPTAPVENANENLRGEAAPAPGNQNREGGRRQQRRHVGAKLTAHCSAEPIPPSFEPSKVSLQLQQAKQLGATPKNVSSREVKVLVEAPGLSASQDIGLKSFALYRAIDA